MNLVIPLVIFVAAIAGVLTNAFIIEYNRDDWKKMLKRALFIGLALSIFLGLLNYFSMVKTIGINLIILFMVIFTIAFWSVYISFKMDKPKKMLQVLFL